MTAEPIAEVVVNAVVDTLAWRYLPNGTVKHALRYSAARIAVCGVGPHWSAPDDWYGTGSQAEYETAASLRECRRCLDILGVRR